MEGGAQVGQNAAEKVKKDLNAGADNFEAASISITQSIRTIADSASGVIDAGMILQVKNWNSIFKLYYS